MEAGAYSQIPNRFDQFSFHKSSTIQLNSDNEKLEDQENFFPTALQGEL